MTNTRYSVGSYILDELADRGWDCDRLADEAGIDVSAIERLILGKDPMRQEFAEGLATAFGTTIGLWLRLAGHNEPQS